MKKWISKQRKIIKFTQRILKKKVFENIIVEVIASDLYTKELYNIKALKIYKRRICKLQEEFLKRWWCG